MKITEIFESIHGEVNGHHQGRICTFIRTSGCNLRCYYCDTPGTQNPIGENTTFDSILDKIKYYNNQYLCITGGEPLLNKSQMVDLLSLLHFQNYKISVETNGTIDITPFYQYVESFVVDYKVGVDNYKPFLKNYINLRNTDVIKFVVGSEKDIIEIVNNFSFLEHQYKNKTQKPVISFSPIISETFTPKILFTGLKNNGIHNVLISVQIHKYIGFN